MPDMNGPYDLLILGGGTAGLTAAVYARRAGKTVLVLEKESLGGQISSSPHVENFPSVAAVSGMEFADRLYEQATALGAEVEIENAVSLSREGENWTVKTDYGAHTGRTLVIATGMTHKRLGLDGEEDLVGRGVSFCAVCDGALFRGKDVAVAGGGNTALQDAIFLSEFCRSVTVIHRRDAFRAEQHVVDTAKGKSNLSFRMNRVITELRGGELLTGLTLRDTVTGETEVLPVSGLFEAVGYQPQNELYRDFLALDEAGFIVAGEDCLTSVPGVFAAGDCRAKSVRQLTTAAADGTVAALAAIHYLDGGR